MREGAALDAAASVIHPLQGPEVAYPQVLTASGEAHVRAPLARMSVEQKVGQIIQADIGSVTPQDVREYHLGSVLNGRPPGRSPARRVGQECVTPRQSRWSPHH